MKNSKPVRLLVTSMLTLLLVVSSAGIIPDADTALLSNILLQGIEQVKSLEETYQKVKEFTDFAKQTKASIQSMQHLEQRVQDELRSATGIKDFKFSDVQFFLDKYALGQLDPKSYLPRNSSYLELLTKVGSPSIKNQQIGVELFNLYRQPTGQSGAGVKGKTVYEQLALERYLSDQQGSNYQVLNEYANRFQQQALEIESTVKQEKLFSMNSAERIELLLKASLLTEKSVELKMKADDLLQKNPPKTLLAAKNASDYIAIQSSLAARALEGRKQSESIKF